MSETVRTVKVVFQPSGRTVSLPEGLTLAVAAAKAGIKLQKPCGGGGTCGKCRVIVHGGDCPPSARCQVTFTGDQVAMGMRLSCQCTVQSDCVVEIPPESLVNEQESKILTTGDGEDLEVSPLVVKLPFVLPEPCSEDSCSDLKRLEKGLGMALKPDLSALRALPSFLRQNAFSGTAVVRNGTDLVSLERGDTADDCFGVAFDIGTTTIVGTLMDLSNAREVGVSARMNPQIPVGDDVISRIQAVRERGESLEEMRSAVIGAVNAILAELASQAGIQLEEIYDVTLAGNTTMQHIICGISPEALGAVPFPPAFSRHMTLCAGEMGIVANPAACVYVFPNVGGFVGGDTVAGIISTALAEAQKATVFVDIGTNGEIVLVHDGQLRATSTAAGPSFEGARIANGMRATDGAIEKIWFEDGDIQINVIGTRGAAGLCGTALIDLAAVLLELQVVDTTGRLLPTCELPPSVPPAIRDRLHEDENGTVDFLLVEPGDSSTGDGVRLFQRDLRELQLASGAIRAGVNIMLRQAGLTVGDVDEVLLAGAFGNYIRRENACRIGLLPAIPVKRIRFVGNAASTGSKMVLLSRRARDLADRIAADVEHVDLSSDPEFQMEFGMAMLFP